MSRLSNSKRFETEDSQRPAVVLSKEEAAEASRLLRKLMGQTPESQTVPASQKAAEAILIVPGLPEAPSALDRYIKTARAIVRCRRRRERHFSSALFSEPAWDILLSLFIADEREARMTVSRLAEETGSPLTTALRWLDYLDGARLITREQSSTDRRKIFVALTDKGRDGLMAYLDGVADDLNELG